MLNTTPLELPVRVTDSDSIVDGEGFEATLSRIKALPCECVQQVIEEKCA